MGNQNPNSWFLKKLINPINSWVLKKFHSLNSTCIYLCIKKPSHNSKSNHNLDHSQHNPNSVQKSFKQAYNSKIKQQQDKFLKTHQELTKTYTEAPIFIHIPQIPEQRNHGTTWITHKTNKRKGGKFACDWEF